MPNRVPHLVAESSAIQEDGLWRARRICVPLGGGLCEVNGTRLRDFASNDYLGLAGDLRVVAAASRAMDEYGIGARASALVVGRTPAHDSLESRLAEFEGEEACVLFPSGYAANVGTITALAGKQDIIFCDRLNHASLVDGCRLSGAKVRVYRHQELDKLRSRLQGCTGYRRRLIVTDSIFSMDGDAAPLEQLCDIAEQHDATLIVDEAHATGLFGERGRGIAELRGVQDRVHVRIGTLSKAIGSLGGFVAGSTELVEFLWNRARTQIFSTALPPAVCAAAEAAVKIIQTQPERRQAVLDLASMLREQLTAGGLNLPAEGIAPIIPILLDTPSRAMDVAGRLEREGFFVASIRPPTVPRGTSRLRITLSATHTADDVNQLAEAIIRVAT